MLGLNKFLMTASSFCQAHPSSVVMLQPLVHARSYEAAWNWKKDLRYFVLRFSEPQDPHVFLLAFALWRQHKINTHQWGIHHRAATLCLPLKYIYSWILGIYIWKLQTKVALLPAYRTLQLVILVAIFATVYIYSLYTYIKILRQVSRNVLWRICNFAPTPRAEPQPPSSRSLPLSLDFPNVKKSTCINYMVEKLYIVCIRYEGLRCVREHFCKNYVKGRIVRGDEINRVSRSELLKFKTFRRPFRQEARLYIE